MQLTSLLFIEVRRLIFPFQRLESHVSKKGKILDLGCGHGHFSKLLAKTSKDRTVIGIDPSIEKIKKAKLLSRGIKNLKFKKSYIENLTESGFDTIIISDVLYLLSDDNVLLLLKEVKNRLNKKGTLILKEVEQKKGIFYYVMLVQEIIMIRLLKKTYSDQSTVFPRSRKRYKKLTEKGKFKLKKTFSITGILPYPHVVFVFQKVN